MIIYADISEKKLTLRDRDAYQEFIESQGDGLYSIEIKRSKRLKTPPQLGYYWGYVVKRLSNYLGYTPEEMHNALKYEHLKRIDENGLVIVGSVKKLSTDEMSTYTTKIRLWAQDIFDYKLIPPDKNWRVANVNI